MPTTQTQTLPAETIDAINRQITDLRAAFTSPSFERPEDHPMVFVSSGARNATRAYRITLYTALIEDLTAALSVLHYWISDEAEMSSEADRLDASTRRKVARSVANEISTHLTDAQARVVMFGPRNRHVID